MSHEQPLILIVDDESHILHVLQMKLQNAGFAVLTAQDGREGLALALEHLPQLVITDFQMPVLSGLQMCQQLRANGPTRETPVLMLTARGFTLTSDQLAQTNIAQVMSKPFSPREVLARAKELIGLPTAEEERSA